jgi:hypothetical protein
MKRTELLTKYQPTYPLVQEVDKQLNDTRLALAKEESSPVKEEVTDQNPTYAWMNGELAKAKADMAGFQARETALTTIIGTYGDQARKLEQQGILQSDLTRQQKADEANYLLYTQKKEEARIEDALDRTRLLNVSVVQTPGLPSLPTRSPFILGLVAVLLACAVSIGVVFAIDYADQSFRNTATATATATETAMATAIIRLTSTLIQPAQSSRSEGKSHVSRLFRTSRATLRCDAGPEIPVSQSGPPRSSGLALLRDRIEPRLHVADCPARHGQDDAAVPFAHQV